MQWEPPLHGAALIVSDFQGILEMRAESDRPGTGVSVDLGATVASGFRKLPLIRAMGDRVQTVADATAGLCGDAWLLAIAGFHVTAFERSPLIAQLIRDGLARAARDPRINAAALARLTFIQGDAAQLLGAHTFDAVLVDPMFPPKRKSSALPRKEIRLLRAAVGDDLDTPHLIAAARRAAVMRVAVKRADDSPDAISTDTPDLRFSGRTSRFDVYLSHSTDPHTL